MTSTYQKGLVPNTTQGPAQRPKEGISSSEEHRMPYFFTVLTARSSDFTSNQSFPIQKMFLSENKIPLLLVLLSTSHTNLLEDTDAFVPLLIRQCFDGIGTERAVDILCAVVDLVPYRPDNNKTHQVIDTRSTGIGTQGISIMVIESDAAVPDLWSTPGVDQRAQRIEQPEVANLIFRFHSSLRPRALTTGPYYPSTHEISHIVQLPLANTVFHNGRRSTMLVERWLVARDPSKEFQMHRKRAKILSHQYVDMADLESNRHHKYRCYFKRIEITSTLKPITPPRVVNAAIGNILRRFRTANDSEESMPASQELEEAIAAFNAESGTAPQAVAVWASVTPRGNWVSQPRVPSVEMGSALGNGTRYHKVLSGGGGWGNKQGLLALDPDYKLEMPQNEVDSPSENGIGTEEADTEALEQIVKPGDVVVFLAHTAHTKDEFGAGRPSRPSQNYQITGPRLIALGSMSSSVDDMGSLASSSLLDGETDSESEPAYIFMPDYFGALSEKGIRVQINLHSATGSPNDGAQRTGTIVETKLDVPGTFVTYGHRTPVKALPLSGKRNNGCE